MRALRGLLLGMGVLALQASPGNAQTTSLPPTSAPVPLAAPVPVQPMVPQVPPIPQAPQSLPPIGLGNNPVPPPLPYDPRTQTQTQSWQVPAPGGRPVPLVQEPPQLGSPVPGQPVPPPLIVPPPPPPPANPVNLWAGPAGWPTRPAQPAGWFVDAGFDILEPEVRNHLSNTVTLPSGASTTVALPGVKLDWTAMPELEVGYRFQDGLGAFAINYRFIVSDGRIFQSGADGTDELRSRLDVNLFDFDYVTNTFEPLPRLEVTGRIGARLGLSYYDTQLTGDFTDLRESNYYVGAGPHAALVLNRRIPLVPGLAVGGKIDGAILVGQDKQDFLATAFDAGGIPSQGGNSNRGTITSEMLAIEAGLSYRVPDLESLRFSTGYRFEQWWDMGRTNGSGMDLTTNGFFFRVEYGF